MTAKQLVTPNLDPIVYEGGKVLRDWYEECLGSVETAFGTARLYKNAAEAWNHVEHKHENQDFPRNVYFLIWFSGYGGLGHVAFAYVNDAGQLNIWTSPYEHVPYFWTGYHTIEALRVGYKLDAFLGWSEDLAGTRVIELITDPTPPPAPAGPDYDGNSITVQPGWGLSNAAEAAGYPDAGTPFRWSIIAKMNGSDDWQAFNASLLAGQRIIVGKYGDQTTTSKNVSNITYRKLDAPLTFVTKLTPTHVWQLDFATYQNAASAYDMPADAPFVAYGIAQRTDLDKPAYYMTQDDFGNADTTGVPTNNRGVNTVDLKAAPAVNVEAPVAPTVPSGTTADEGEKVDVKVLDPTSTAALDIKYGYTAFLSPQRYNAIKLDQHVKEVRGLTKSDGTPLHPDQQLVPSQSVLVAGKMVNAKGQSYYRTVKSVENGLYYAIPEADLRREDDISKEELEDLMKDGESFLEDTRDKVVEATGGFFSRLFHRNKK